MFVYIVTWPWISLNKYVIRLLHKIRRKHASRILWSSHTRCWDYIYDFYITEGWSKTGSKSCTLYLLLVVKPLQRVAIYKYIGHSPTHRINFKYSSVPWYSNWWKCNADKIEQARKMVLMLFFSFSESCYHAFVMTSEDVTKHCV